MRLRGTRILPLPDVRRIVRALRAAAAGHVKLADKLERAARRAREKGLEAILVDITREATSAARATVRARR